MFIRFSIYISPSEANVDNHVNELLIGGYIRDGLNIILEAVWLLILWCYVEKTLIYDIKSYSVPQKIKEHHRLEQIIQLSIDSSISLETLSNMYVEVTIARQRSTRVNSDVRTLEKSKDEWNGLSAFPL